MCTNCGFSYHLGACSGVTKTAFKAQDRAMKNNWTCQTCVVLAAQMAAGMRKEKHEQASGVERMLSENNTQLTQLPAIMNKVEELMLLKHTVSKLEQTVRHFSDVYDQVLATMETHSSEIAV